MEMKGNNIDKLFKEGLFEHEVSPPQEVWTNISEQLKKKNSKKLVVLWYRIAAGIAILIVSSLLLTKNTNKNTGTNVQVAESTQTDLEEGTGNDENKKAIETQQPIKEKEQDNKKDIQKEINKPRTTIANQQNEIVASIEEKEKSSKIPELFKIKSEEEQFGTAGNSKDRIIDQPLEQLAMLNIVFDMEIPKDQIYYEQTELNHPIKNTEKSNQWEIGGYYAPIYSYRALGIGSQDLQENSLLSESEQGQYAYAGGISVNYQISERVSIGAGLSVVNHSYKVSNVTNLTANNNLALTGYSMSYKSYQTFSVNNSIGQITTSGDAKVYSNTQNTQRDAIMLTESQSAINNNYALPDNQVIDQTFNYMEIPLLMRIKLIDKNLGLHFVSGISSYFLVDNKVTIKSPDQEDITGKTTHIKTTNISGSLGLGLNYSLSKSLEFNMEPMFKIFLNSINTTNSINVYPYTFGIYSGIFYHF